MLVARDAARLAEVEQELAALDARSARPHRHDRPHRRRPDRRRIAGARRTGTPAVALWRKVGIVACLPAHRRRRRHPGGALRPGPPARASLVGQRERVAGPADRAAAGAGVDAERQGEHQGGARALQQGALRGSRRTPPRSPPPGSCSGTSERPPRSRRWCGSDGPRSRRSVKDSPTYYQGHLFYGLVLENQDHNHAAAVAQFNDFLADDPPAAELPQAAPLVAPAYQAAGAPAPRRVHDDQHVSPVAPAGRRRRGRTPPRTRRSRRRWSSTRR